MDHIEGQVGLADTKAALLVAANAILAGVILSAIKDFELSGWPIVLSLILLFAALSFSLLAVFPLSFLPWFNFERDRSLYYFKHIARVTNHEFYEQFSCLEEKEADHQLLCYVKSKAHWVNLKFATLRLAGLCTALCVVMGAASLMGPAWGRVVQGEEAFSASSAVAMDSVMSRIEMLEEKVMVSNPQAATDSSKVGGAP